MQELTKTFARTYENICKILQKHLQELTKHLQELTKHLQELTKTFARTNKNICKNLQKHLQELRHTLLVQGVDYKNLGNCLQSMGEHCKNYCPASQE